MAVMPNDQISAYEVKNTLLNFVVWHLKVTSYAQLLIHVVKWNQQNLDIHLTLIYFIQANFFLHIILVPLTTRVMPGFIISVKPLYSRKEYNSVINEVIWCTFIFHNVVHLHESCGGNSGRWKTLGL